VTGTQERRYGAEGSERWPALYAPLAFAVAMTLALLVGGLISAIASAAGVNVREGTPVLTITLTVVQDAAFVVSAWFFAARGGRVRLRDFGLTRLPVGRAARWTAGAIVAWYAFNVAYASLFPGGKQDTLDALGTNQGGGLLIASTIFVVLLAPFAEEIFFRGFCYCALRNRFGRWPAALIVGGVFGAIHYSGTDTLSLLVPLAVLGALFCVLYERTGSLYPAIVLHIINNAAALAITAEASAAPLVAAITAAIGLGACAALATARTSPRPATP
jgi:membrane protease YdiL (CAAX protease family)